VEYNRGEQREEGSCRREMRGSGWEGVGSGGKRKEKGDGSGRKREDKKAEGRNKKQEKLEERQKMKGRGTQRGRREDLRVLGHKYSFLHRVIKAAETQQKRQTQFTYLQELKTTTIIMDLICRFINTALIPFSQAQLTIK